jgi:hypothetical protein
MKTQSRQRKWQIRHKQAGLCDTCSAKAVMHTKCAKHWLESLCHQRDLYRNGNTRRYQCLSDMIQYDILSGDGFCDATNERILKKFGRKVDIREFMGETGIASL